MPQNSRDEIMKKALSSVSAALSHAQAIISSLGDGGHPGDLPVAAPELPAGPCRGAGAADDNAHLQQAYAYALRCRLEIQYAILLIQKGLSIDVSPSPPLSSRPMHKSGVAAALKADLEGALSALESGSPGGAGPILLASDSKAALLISRIRDGLKKSALLKHRDPGQ